MLQSGVRVSQRRCWWYDMCREGSGPGPPSFLAMVTINTLYINPRKMRSSLSFLCLPTFSPCAPLDSELPCPLLPNPPSPPPLAPRECPARSLQSAVRSTLGSASQRPRSCPHRASHADMHGRSGRRRGVVFSNLQWSRATHPDIGFLSGARI